jgi:hypothetical protein
MQRDRGQCFIQVEAVVVDRLRAMRRPGESYSQVISRLVELETGPPPDRSAAHAYRRRRERLERAGSGLIGIALGRAGARPKRASIEMHFGQTLIEAFSNALRPPTTTPSPRARLHFPATAARFGSAAFFVSLSSALRRRSRFRKRPS